jgi:hypothetical protein
LQEYLKQPQEWLNRTFPRFCLYTGKNVRGYLEKLDVYTYPEEEETRTYVATLNPAYFNKSLGSDVPQLITVYLDKKSYPHMKRVTQAVMKRGALKPLENILTPGKTTVEKP